MEPAEEAGMPKRTHGNKKVTVIEVQSLFGTKQGINMYHTVIIAGRTEPPTPRYSYENEVLWHIDVRNSSLFWRGLTCEKTTDTENYNGCKKMTISRMSLLVRAARNTCTSVHVYEHVQKKMSINYQAMEKYI